MRTKTLNPNLEILNNIEYSIIVNLNIRNFVII
jgi:hypothetical protein